MGFKVRLRLYLFTVVLLAGFTLLLVRLWGMQIERHREFAALVPGTREVKVRVPGVRGQIRDRNGVVLVSNRASYEVVFNVKEIVDAYREQIRRDGGEMPMLTYEVWERGFQRRRTEIDVVEIVRESILPTLESLGLARPFSSRSLQLNFRATRGLVPWVYQRDLTYEEFAAYAEHNLGLPGVTVAARPIREYVYGAMAAHYLGYVRLAEDSQVPTDERAEWDFYVGDDFGVTGVEKSMNEFLRGRPGVRTMLRDEKGAIVGQLGYVEPRPGADVYLTIDARLQYIVERVLRDSGVGRAGAVVTDPETGEILAMASVPSFDPNWFIPAISRDRFESITRDPSHPLINRAVTDYAPGSTYKIPIALAGALAGIQNQRFNCPGGVQYGSHYMRCWIASRGGAHGTIDLSEAIMRSCNCFFYRYGNAAGIERIKEMGRLLGLDGRTGIPIDNEDPGILPGPEWLRARNPRERWSDGYTANTSIGQGFTEATPLQMALVTGTVANGGRSYRARLVSRIVDSEGEVIRNDPPELIADLEEHNISRQDVEVVKRGMWRVIHEVGGTARASALEDHEAGGKTGTAQVTRRGRRETDSWFIMFAPYEDARYSVAVFTESARSGGGVSAPIAHRILEQALAMEQGWRVRPQRLEPAEGHFEFIEQVVFDDSGHQPTADELDWESEDVGVIPSVEPAIQAVPVAEPTIEPEADEGPDTIPRAVPVPRAGLWDQGGPVAD